MALNNLRVSHNSAASYVEYLQTSSKQFMPLKKRTHSDLNVISRSKPMQTNRVTDEPFALKIDDEQVPFYWQTNQHTLPLIKRLESVPSLKFQIFMGNNGKLVRNVLLATWAEYWYETPTVVPQSIMQSEQAYQQPNGHFNLRWAPTSKQINFERMS
jgi:hypothetical protein